VRPSGRLPSALKRPCGFLIEGNLAVESERQIRSFTKWLRCDWPGFRLYESAWEPRVSTEAPQMHRYGCDKAPNPARGPQQLSKLHCSGGVRMLILELRGASRHCALLLRQEVWLGDIELFDSGVEFGTSVWRQWNRRLWLPAGKELSQ